MTTSEGTQRPWHHALPSSVEVRHLVNALPNHFYHPSHAKLSDPDYGEMTWSSRAHRKNRYQTHPPGKPNASRHGVTILHKLWHMTRIEYWNVSWWVAISFTLGSVVWVINGFAGFLPLVNSHFTESEAWLGWTAWIGATVFEAGSILGVLEAWNRDDAAHFGREFGKLLYHSKEKGSSQARINDHDSEPGLLSAAESNPKIVSEKTSKPWIWFTAEHKYWHELGFLAAFSQLCAATIFWISGFTALPHIQNAIKDHTASLDILFWTPQVVGGSGFIISATFIMLETQKKWFLPRPLSIGWHIGFWNFVGAIGFTLCGALGYSKSSGASYQSYLSTFWGGWAFLIGSVLQWYEAVNSLH